jgi:hypothetical protein
MQEFLMRINILKRIQEFLMRISILKRMQEFLMRILSAHICSLR